MTLNKPSTTYPLYAKVALLCISLFAIVSILYITQAIIVPIIYSIIIAIALSPIVNFLVCYKFNRTVAISVTLLVVLLFSSLIIILLSNQLIQFTDSFPQLVKNFDALLAQSVKWTAQNFNVSTQQINTFIAQKNNELLQMLKAAIGQTLINTGGALIVLVLIPVYVFLILYYQPLLISFIHQIFSSPTKSNNVSQILTATKKIIQSYLIGLLFEALIVAALNSSSLLIIGINYAVLLGVIGALLNIIPYIGGIIAVALPMLIALATKSPSYAVIVLVTYLCIQFIDNNFIIAKVVAAKVQLNALVSIVVVLMGGALWGVPGMFLSIPLTAIIKVVCDHVPELKPWGYLLGNTIQASTLKKAQRI